MSDRCDFDKHEWDEPDSKTTYCVDCGCDYRDAERIKQLEDVLDVYATPAEWTAEVFLQGENEDGTEWELTHDLDSEKVWNRDEHGWMLAQRILDDA